MIGSVRHRPDAMHDGKNHDTVAELVKQASEQLTDVVRSEMRLAQAEMKEKGKRAGFGGGMFGGAAIMGLLALWSLVFAAIAGVALVLPVWAAALIIGGGLLLVAGVLALAGKKQFGSATPPKPERTIDSVKADVEAIKEGAHR
ncbi:Putative Holin-X, holin superfamily III [Streptomyces sp. WMMB 714]|jgi:Flp pilus assembly protein TadB|uniref:Membrane protein n=1 Tax=Streptomyces daqingensis TaxID=1472640 RepID=A0ABQ2M1D8_9ACTN|nr:MULTISPECIES: phage holin family protein [Streptomyces]GGO45555.1 membrane protein [Streptomyces daqingensis]SCK42099.1 Putative Holin-X, holin superfamily III [Streptomyces sp. WMMB 714]